MTSRVPSSSFAAYPLRSLKPALFQLTRHAPNASACIAGPGMTDEQRGRAFGRSWRAPPGEGSGLGLAIARRLVETDEDEINSQTYRRRSRCDSSPPSRLRGEEARVVGAEGERELTDLLPSTRG